MHTKVNIKRDTFPPPPEGGGFHVRFFVTTEIALKLVEVATETLVNLLRAIQKAKGADVDVSALNIPESYYDGLKEKGLTEQEIAELKEA